MYLLLLALFQSQVIIKNNICKRIRFHAVDIPNLTNNSIQMRENSFQFVYHLSCQSSCFLFHFTLLKDAPGLSQAISRVAAFLSQ